jgi:hypothetical protein
MAFDYEDPGGGLNAFGILAGVVAVIVALVAIVGGFAFLISFKGVDSGEICVVKEGGPFDGRDVKEVRDPGSGVKPIGPFNSQHCLPVTERDSNDVIEGEPTFPTRDAVQVIADGQLLFTLTQDKEKVEEFYRRYARRNWGGEPIWEDEGWLNFHRERTQPVILDALRSTIGEFDCIQLNNLCQYVQNAKAAIEKGEIEKVDNTQNLEEAADAIEERVTTRLRDAFGDDYFENIRYQNLRIRFEPEQEAAITQAQTARTEIATATLDAQRRVEDAKGDRRVAREQNKAIREKARGYRLNPAQADIDKITALCGSDGCGELQVLGGNALTLLGGSETP